MKLFIFNPFRYIAGGRALIIGLAIIVLTAIVAWFSNTHFPDVISLKTSAGLPLPYLFLQVFANWLVLSATLYIFAKAASSSSIRAIDIFGTQALARFPYLPGALIGFSGAMERFAQFILSKTIQPDLQVSISTFDIGMAVILMIVSLLLLIWLITLMYNAFSISANMKGAKAIIGFIICLLVSVGITMFISYQGYKWLS